MAKKQNLLVVMRFVRYQSGDNEQDVFLFIKTKHVFNEKANIMFDIFFAVSEC